MHQRKKGERTQVSLGIKETETLVKEWRQMRKQWRNATEKQREGISVLQEEFRSRLAALGRADHLRKKKREKEYVRTAFFRNPLRFLKGLFNQEKGGKLRTVRLEVEEC